MNKVIRDGKVAVLISPGFGAGWFSWNREYPECLFDPDIVKLVEERNSIDERLAANITKDIQELAEKKWPDGYWSAHKLQIEWVPEGTQFEIREYDGAESLIFAERQTWIIT
jgi:hypothetical protein